jgi:hypothetical protein
MQIKINPKNKKAERNSNFELLRIICIFGIITMHTYGAIYSTATGMSLVLGVLINSLFNTCVTCFILISGYFGVKFNLKKLLMLDIMIVFFSILSILIYFVVGKTLPISVVIKACIPVISGTYWYISCYFALVIFSPFINQISEKLSKKSFEILIGIMLLIFSIIPSFFYFELIHDGGKGLVNMILVYLIGRYIKLYWTRKYAKKGLLITIMSLVGITFCLNMGITVASGNIGVNAPFARDLSITIIASAVAIFMLFKEFNFKSKLINFLACNVLATYVFEGFVRNMLNHYIHIADYTSIQSLSIVLLAYVLMVMIICFIVNIVRTYTIGKLEAPIADIEIKIINQFGKLLIGTGRQMKPIIKKYLYS